MTAAKSDVAAVAFRWLGRTLALLLVLFWGAFFLEHVAEWFGNLQGPLPPARVWIGQVLHLGMLAGLVLMLWREWLGAIVTVLTTAAFFASIGMHGFPYIALINLLPIACFAVSWYLPPRVRPACPVAHGSPG
jgi:hypothetical protein